ncbi:MAG: hypothetical protein IJG00_03160 [Clostridia bacterium]|nr:hypothetical protein [Clostridia bacterium]
MIITKLLMYVSIVTLIFNQIVIILEKEKMEKKIKVILKIVNGEPLAKKEGKYAEKFKGQFIF